MPTARRLEQGATVSRLSQARREVTALVLLKARLCCETDPVRRESAAPNAVLLSASLRSIHFPRDAKHRAALVWDGLCHGLRLRVCASARFVETRLRRSP